MTPEKIWKLYDKDVQYKTKLDLFNKVKKQENFFLGKQWEGVNAPDLPKPVLNFTKRVTNYLISVLCVDDIGIGFRDYTPDSIEQPEKTQAAQLMEDILPKEIERINENVKFKSKIRRILHNGAVTGDGAVYVRFDTDKGVVKAGDNQPTRGEIDVEIIPNTRLHFGNTLTAEVEKQPYIIISKQELTKELKEKYPEKERDIVPDGGITDTIETTNDDDITTVLIYMFKKNGTVHSIVSTEKVILEEEIDTELKRYPVSFFNWEAVENQYHGIGVVEEVIPNQIEVNKLWAMALLFQKNQAFPKTFIDVTKVQNWDNRVGGVYRVTGNVNDAFATSFKSHDMSAQVQQMVEQTISLTKEFMGANDAVLGNINPQNTSAIIQVQKASSAPLELQRLSFYQFIEDYVRILIDHIRSKYGVRYFWGENGIQVIDYSELDYNSEIMVDIGASAYWSEMAQVQTMDNLFGAGVIQDALLYVKSIPDKNLPNKNEIIQYLEEKKQMEEMMIQQQMMQQQMGAMTNEMQMQ